MRKTAAILLFSLYLVSSAALYELFKIDVLLEHFKETKVTEPSVSFLDFLIMHYITDDGNSRDNDRDNKLPFKSASSHIAGNSIVFTLQ